MALVIRYFSTSSAGAGDGTTWANRAALFSSGNWSSVITGHNFGAGDALDCLIGPGVHSCGQILNSTLFSSPPTVANPILLRGADATGAALVPPAPGWISAQPAWDSASMPHIVATGNLTIMNIAINTGLLRMLRFSVPGGSSVAALSIGQCLTEWCIVENGGAGTQARAMDAPYASNCVFRCTGSSYESVVRLSAQAYLHNCRIEGNLGATTGTRVGVNHASFATNSLFGCTVVNNPGDGIVSMSTQAAQDVRIVRCIIAGNGGAGIRGSTTASQSRQNAVVGCMITGNGSHGIAAEASRMAVASSRLRDNTSGNFSGVGNYPTDLGIDVSAGTDAAEYVDAANGDYRIKATSALWGKGIGAGDEIPTPASVAAAVWSRVGRTLT